MAHVKGYKAVYVFNFTGVVKYGNAKPNKWSNNGRYPSVRAYKAFKQLKTNGK